MTAALAGSSSTYWHSMPGCHRPQTSGPVGASAMPASTLTEGAGAIRRLTITLAVLSCCLLTWWAREADASRVTVEQAVCLVFRDRCPMALRVARCESRLDPSAVSPTSDVGLFQINYRAHRRRGESFASFRARYSDVATNVLYAYRLSRGGRDWGSHWYMSRRCWA